MNVELMEAIKGRRSIRAYKPDPVFEEQLQDSQGSARQGRGADEEKRDIRVFVL